MQNDFCPCVQGPASVPALGGAARRVVGPYGQRTM